MTSDWKRQSDLDLDRKIRTIEKVQIKDKLTFLHQKIKALEKSFKETLETLTGTSCIKSMSRRRTMLTEEYFEEGRTKARTKTVEDIKASIILRMKEDGTMFWNSRLRNIERKKEIPFNNNKERAKDEVYRNYIAESKLKNTVKKVKERVEKKLGNPENTRNTGTHLRKNSAKQKSVIPQKKQKKGQKKPYCSQCLFLLRKGFPMKYCDCHLAKKHKEV